jgi:hypothetical protein
MLRGDKCYRDEQINRMVIEYRRRREGNKGKKFCKRAPLEFSTGITLLYYNSRP